MNRTPFYRLQENLGGKMIEFFGWDMPVQFTTITDEHNAVRNDAGLFDISHMGQVFVWGPDAQAYLENLLTNDISKIALGQGRYAHMLNPAGGVIDDVYAFRVEDASSLEEVDKFLVIVNASRKDGDIAWMEQQKGGFDVQIMEGPQAAGLALQGPKAKDIIQAINDKPLDLKKNEIGDFEFGEANALVSRTGYTGEDGFEFFAPAGHLLIIWSLLLKAGKPFGLKPAGLGARDTLRTEVAYPLYGHELDEKHTPFDAGLNWVVKLDKGPFIGREALQKQKAEGCLEKLIGFEIVKGGVARPESDIFINGKKVSTVTSGTFSPTLKKAIGMAYLPKNLSSIGQKLTIKAGGREFEAVTVPLPFYKKP